MPHSRSETIFLLSCNFEDLDLPTEHIALLFRYQRIDENHLHPRHFEEALELNFKEDKLDGLIYWLTGLRNEIALTEIKRTSFPTLAPRRNQRYLVPNELGDHVLGGDIPAEFEMPVFQEAFTIYYLGHVAATDFPVLPFQNLHLFVPELHTFSLSRKPRWWPIYTKLPNFRSIDLKRSWGNSIDPPDPINCRSGIK